MRHIHADNNQNESQIDFVVGDRDGFSTFEEFYSAAIRLLWVGWDSRENADKYIANAKKKTRTSAELRVEVAECLAITPVADFHPELDETESVISFRDDWNVKEFVWCTGKQYWFMSWDTAP